MSKNIVVYCRRSHGPVCSHVFDAALNPGAKRDHNQLMKIGKVSGGLTSEGEWQFIHRVKVG